MGFQMKNRTEKRKKAGFMIAVFVLLLSVFAIGTVVYAADPPQGLLQKVGISLEDFRIGLKGHFHKTYNPKPYPSIEEYKKAKEKQVAALFEQYRSEGKDVQTAMKWAKYNTYSDSERRRYEKNVYMAFRMNGKDNREAMELMNKYFAVVDTPWEGWTDFGDATKSYHEGLELGKAYDKKLLLSGKHITVRMKAALNDKPFGSVSPKDVSRAIEKSYGIRIDTKSVEMPEIKLFGTYGFKVHLRKKVIVEMFVDVVPEQQNDVLTSARREQLLDMPGMSEDSRKLGDARKLEDSRKYR